jgi:ribosome-binding ATPase
MRTAIIGLPMVGKTSLFTILTGVHEATRVGQMEARIGMTKVPDPRLAELAKLFNPPKLTYATVEYLDVPALTKEALANPSYVGSLRQVDALAHVLRVFESDTVPHEKGSVDAVRDAEDLDVELLLNDLVVVEKRLERLDKDRKKLKDPKLDQEYALLERFKAALTDTIPLRNLEISADEEKLVRGFQLLSLKPMLYVLNVGEEDAAKMAEVEAKYRSGPLGNRPQTAVTAVAGKIEAELAELSPEEAKDLLESYGLKEPGINRMIDATYSLLGLMSVLTAGDTEVRAWTIPIGSKAPQAGGAIHTDLEKKFIRAQVVNWKDLCELGGYPGVREKGLLRLEGREYVVQDGDVIEIRHS